MLSSPGGYPFLQPAVPHLEQPGVLIWSNLVCSIWSNLVCSICWIVFEIQPVVLCSFFFVFVFANLVGSVEA